MLYSIVQYIFLWETILVRPKKKATILVPYNSSQIVNQQGIQQGFLKVIKTTLAIMLDIIKIIHSHTTLMGKIQAKS